MKTMRSDVTRRTVGTVAGVALAFGLVAGAAADAYIDENGVPVASSGTSTVSIVGGEPVILAGDDADDELSVLIEEAEANEASIDDSASLSVADASGGQGNVGVTTP